MTSHYTAIDWESTSFRAWLFESERCLDSRQSAAGITRLNGQSPAAVLAARIHGWRGGRTPMVMAGMVGSSVGWENAPYLPLPADFTAISNWLTAIDEGI